jgi:hypothetical protein
MGEQPARQASTGMAGTIARRRQEIYALALAIVADLADAQLAWSPGPAAPAIRFPLWHLARWADRVQAHLAGATAELTVRLGAAQEIWSVERLAAGWGLVADSLGFGESGMGLDDTASAALPLPGKAALLAYATRAFAAADRAVGVLDDTQFATPCRDLLGRETTVGGAVLNHLLHASRHLGMIEALCGVQGLRGTATR